MNEIIQRTWTAVQEALRTMDNESPQGLRGWKSYRPLTNRSKTDEPAITIDLVQRLFNNGIPAFAEVVYPHRQPGNGIQHCDIVVDLGDRQYFWIEAKVLWTGYWGENGERKYALNKDMCGRVDAFLYDCKNKLLALRYPEASFIGGLLIGFETAEKKVPENHIEKLTSALSDWQSGHNPAGPDSTPSKLINSVECFNRIGFWYRPVSNG